MSNAEDLNRLTACSLVLLGHIFFVLGNHRVKQNLTDLNDDLIVCVYVCVWLILHVFLSPQESSNMVVPAMQLASKIPDMSVQLWSSALLKGKR